MFIVAQLCYLAVILGLMRAPYEVISRLGRRLEGTLAPEAVLPTIVENVAGALRLPWVGIWLTDGDALRLAAAHGDAPLRRQ